MAGDPQCSAPLGERLVDREGNIASLARQAESDDVVAAIAPLLEVFAPDTDYE